MSNSDTKLLRDLQQRVGRPFAFEMEGDRCVGLDLTSEDDPHHGLIRRHSFAEKQAILRQLCRLRNLRKLNLRRNKLGVLPPEFAELRELEVLILGSNCLGQVPPQIARLERLKSLHLGNNDIRELPPFMGGFAHLEYLALHKNLRLKSVSNLAGLTSLRHLNLHYLNLHRLPLFVCSFRRLVTLTVWNITQFPEELANLAGLEFFSDCGSPALRELPPALMQLKKMRMMRLFQNSLTTLPEEIGELEHLEQLSLYQNQLGRLPDSFGRLKKLRKLNLACNRFKQIPSCLSQCESLEWLALFENPIKPGETPPLPARAEVLRHWPFTTLPKA